MQRFVWLFAIACIVVVSGQPGQKQCAYGTPNDGCPANQHCHAGVCVPNLDTDLARRNPLATFRDYGRTFPRGGGFAPRPATTGDVRWQPQGLRSTTDPVDWGLKGKLSAVKDQGNCGSCWAHAVVEQVESFVAIRSGGTTTSALSVQQVTSCDLDCDNCNGCNAAMGLDYVIASGLMPEADYSYKSGTLGCGFGGLMGSDDFCVPSEFDGRCLSLPNHCPAAASSSKAEAIGSCFDGQCALDYFGCCLTQLQKSPQQPLKHNATNQHLKATGNYNRGKQCLYNSATATKSVSQVGYVDADESAMLEFVSKNGPLAIAVNANSWSTYSGGIMTDCEASQIDHAVQLVGFGEEGGVPYWRIRNSWGTSWGEKGFIRVKRGINACSLASTEAVYPVMASDASALVV